MPMSRLPNFELYSVVPEIRIFNLFETMITVIN